MRSIRAQELIKRFYPEKAIHPFRLLLDEAVGQAGVILDAGCGNGQSFQYDYKEYSKVLIGADLLWKELVQNKQVHFSNVADLGFLPFADDTFDLVFSHDVIEHLEGPSIVFAEFARILKRGGKLLVLTPNNYHYFALAGHIVPHSMQKLIARKWLGSSDEVYRTYYRSNSERRMKKLASDAGLEIDDIHFYEPQPRNLSFSPLIFYPAMAYERIVNGANLFAIFRAQIIGIFTKL